MFKLHLNSQIFFIDVNKVFEANIAMMCIILFVFVPPLKLPSTFRVDHLVSCYFCSKSYRDLKSLS